MEVAIKRDIMHPDTHMILVFVSRDLSIRFLAPIQLPLRQDVGEQQGNAKIYEFTDGTLRIKVDRVGDTGEIWILTDVGEFATDAEYVLEFLKVLKAMTAEIPEAFRGIMADIENIEDVEELERTFRLVPYTMNDPIGNRGNDPMEFV